MAKMLWSLLLPASMLVGLVGCQDNEKPKKSASAPKSVQELQEPEQQNEPTQIAPTTSRQPTILRDLQVDEPTVEAFDWADWYMPRVWQTLEKESGLKRGSNFIQVGNGTKYRAGMYDDDFHWNMQFHLKYPAKADFFNKAYREHLHNGFLDQDEKLRTLVQGWIGKFIYYFGSPHVDYTKLLKKHKELDLEVAKNPELARRLAAFTQRTTEFHAASDLYRPLASISEATPERKLRVMILSTPGGGGHLTVAQSIQEYLDSGKAGLIETTFVDIAGFKDDPLYVASNGKIHSEDTYNIFFQKELNERKWQLYWGAINQIQRFIPDRQVENIAAKIMETRPDIIINTTSHKNEFIQFGYEFGVPTIIVSTDYMVQYFLIEHLDTLDPNLIRYASPSSFPEYFTALRELPYRPHTFKPYVEEYGDTMKEAIRHYIVERTPGWDWERFCEAAPIFDLLGFPVRSAFNEKMTDAELAEVRRAEGVAAGSQVATVAMGRQGVGSLREVVKIIVRDADLLTSPLDLFIVAGDNESMRQELSALYEREGLHPLLRIHVKGLLPGAAMSTLYQLSDVLVTKPGGATTAEAIATGSRVLAPGYHMWEHPNLQFLEMVGLGKSIKDIHHYSDIMELLVEMLNEDASNNDDVKKLQIDWQSNLMDILERSLVNVSKL